MVRVHDQSDGRRQFSAWDHFLALAFAQTTFRGILRDIEGFLSAALLAYHLGFLQRVTRSTLAQANEERDGTLDSTLAHKLMHRAHVLQQYEPTVLDFEMPVYAVGSTPINLSLALCLWANWTGCDLVVRLYTALYSRGPSRAFLTTTAAKHGDVAWLDDLPSSQTAPI